jgi:DNA-binding NarL/FixJ family response regulator
VPVIRIVVVDDQPLVRAGISRILATDPELEIVAECDDGSQVVDCVEEHRPDVVLMDIRMKQVDGAEATRRVGALGDPPPVLILTTFGDDESVAATLSAGAAGFLLKDAPGEEIVRAVRVVAGGGAWLDPSIAGSVIDTFRTTYLPRHHAAGRLEQLTEREREVLTLIGRGMSNREIAAELTVTEATVKTHVGNILDKLRLRDRAAAIVLAFNHGLVLPGDTALS